MNNVINMEVKWNGGNVDLRYRTFICHFPKSMIGYFTIYIQYVTNAITVLWKKYCRDIKST